MLGEHWLIRLRDGHVYMYATQLQLRNNYQRMIIYTISIGVLSIEFKAGPKLNIKNKFMETDPTLNIKWKISYRGVHANITANDQHNIIVPVLERTRGLHIQSTIKKLKIKQMIGDIFTLLAIIPMQNANSRFVGSDSLSIEDQAI